MSSTSVNLPASSSSKAMRQMAAKLLKSQRQGGELQVSCPQPTSFHSLPPPSESQHKSIRPNPINNDDDTTGNKAANSPSTSYSTIQDDDDSSSTTSSLAVSHHSKDHVDHDLPDQSYSMLQPRRPDEAASLLVLEDFWVRTKSPLNYNMTLVHQVIHGPSEQDEYTNSGHTHPFSVSALAVPVKCFRTKAATNPDQLTTQQYSVDSDDPEATSGPEGFLQCMTVLTQDRSHHFKETSDNNNNRFSLFMSTEDWLPSPLSIHSSATQLSIKFFKQNHPHQHFASAWVPLSHLLQHHRDTGQTDLGDKISITTVRRRMKIGTLKYKILFGKGTQLRGYADRVYNQFPGLLVPTDAGEKDGSLHSINNEDNNSHESPMELQSSHLDQSRPSNFGLTARIKKDASPEGDKNGGSTNELSLIHHDLEQKVSQLANQVTSYSAKLLETECELSSLREEVASLRAEKGRHLQIIENSCEKIESLKQSLSNTNEKAGGEINLYKEQVVSLHKKVDNVIRVTRIVHAITSSTTPPPENILDRVEAALSPLLIPQQSQSLTK